MKFLILLSVLISSSSFASVWSGAKEWNVEWEVKYSTWISQRAGTDFFKKLGGPYADLKLDCADVHYGMLAYFSRTNGLAFAANGGKINNRTTKFDAYSGELKMAKFIEYVTQYYGTENLAHTDTIPVGIHSIIPGDIFMYKVGTDGNFTRHTYIIKGINIDGTFDVLYSTQQRAAEGKPLRRRATYEFKKAPLNTGKDANHWGFRRQKRPHLMSYSQESLGADFSQYEIARKLGRLEFFRYVKRTHQTIVESAKGIITRNFLNYCTEVQDRVTAVQSGLKAASNIGNRCMEFGEYDANSTPSRDSGIKDTIRNYGYDYGRVIDAGQSNRLGSDLKIATDSIFRNRAVRSDEAKKLIAMCSVNSSIGAIDLASFKQNLMANRVSFHPNDNKYRRWGVLKGEQTRCQTYYGYPN